MARFDVYRSPGGVLVLNCQSDLLDQLSTRLVVPLLTGADAPKPAQWLNPSFDIDGQAHFMYTQFAASVPAGDLRDKVASLGSEHDRIMAALDMLLTGV